MLRQLELDAHQAVAALHFQLDDFVGALLPQQLAEALDAADQICVRRRRSRRLSECLLQHLAIVELHRLFTEHAREHFELATDLDANHAAARVTFIIVVSVEMKSPTEMKLPPSSSRPNTSSATPSASAPTRPCRCCNIARKTRD